jgi:hypothetical protein
LFNCLIVIHYSLLLSAAAIAYDIQHRVVLEIVVLVLALLHMHSVRCSCPIQIVA